jgi:hypothetical protein
MRQLQPLSVHALLFDFFASFPEQAVFLTLRSQGVRLRERNVGLVISIVSNICVWSVIPHLSCKVFRTFSKILKLIKWHGCTIRGKISFRNLELLHSISPILAEFRLKPRTLGSRPRIDRSFCPKLVEFSLEWPNFAQISQNRPVLIEKFG